MVNSAVPEVIILVHCEECGNLDRVSLNEESGLSEEHVGNVLPVPEVAERLGLSVTRVRTMLSEGALLSIRAGENNVLVVPEIFLVDNRALDSLKGTVILMRDAGFKDEEILQWLFAEDSSLPGRPIDALRSGRKTEVRRWAQALAW